MSSPELPDVTAQIAAIAAEALSVAPESFDLLEVNGDFDFEQASGVDGDALVNGRRVPLSIGFDALDRFHEIRREFERLNQPLWRKATVEVTAAGKATLRLDYTG